MSWITDVLAQLGLIRRLPTSEARRARKVERTLRKADRVIEDYRRMDGAIKIVVERHR